MRRAKRPTPEPIESQALPGLSTFGGRLRMARESMAERGYAKLNQSQLARLVDLEPQRINQIERYGGEMKITSSILAAEALHVRLRWLVMNEPPMESKGLDLHTMPSDTLALLIAWSDLIAFQRARWLRIIARQAKRNRDHFEFLRQAVT